MLVKAKLVGPAEGLPLTKPLQRKFPCWSFWLFFEAGDAAFISFLAWFAPVRGDL